MRQNIDAGYTETLCIMCENAGGSTVQHDNFKVVQKNNCAVALVGTNASPHANVVIPYVNNVALHTAATNSADFFTNPLVASCGAITACELKASGCTNAYTAANLVIDASTGAITAKKNVDAGYVDVVCVKCSNAEASTIT